jgi:hypothetical protein
VGACVGMVGRRRAMRRREPEEDVEPKREPTVVSTFQRSASVGGGGRTVGGGGRTGPVAVADWRRTRTAPRTATTLIETLSPQARLADHLEEREVGAETETHQVCEIACWRGYVTWRFYVDSQSPLEPPLGSPYFRAPGRVAPEQTDVALHAHAVLVDKLVAAGWEPEGYGEDWFAERFQRLTR